MSENPFWNRPDLERLFTPLVGKSMLELGGKQDAGRIYKRYFEALGYRHVSVDIADQEVNEYGALRLDLTKPLNLGTFDMVTNIGTSEHVSEDEWAGQVACWKNILDAMHIGSVLLCDTPKPGEWPKHGTWYPTAAFYEELAEKNGMALERLLESAWRPTHARRRVISARMVRRKDCPFLMPAGKMFHNYRGRCY